MGSGMVVSSPSDSRAEWKATPFFFFFLCKFFPTQLSTTSDSLSESFIFLNTCLHPIIQIQARPMDENFCFFIVFFPQNCSACLPPTPSSKHKVL